MITTAPHATEFDDAGPTADDPSPAEIAAACLQIQATWTSAVRLKRMRPDQRPSFRKVNGEAVTIDLAIYSEHHAAHDAGNLVECTDTVRRTGRG